MKTLVVYDSYFGNTEKVAQAIGESIEGSVVKRPEGVELGTLSEWDLLIVGSPTRGFRPSDAIKSFLNEIPSKSLEGVKVAGFDTRMDPEDVGNPFLKFMVKIFGYAAKPIGDKLVKKGGDLVGENKGFVVTGREGPLREGEVEKAFSWAKTLVS
ncbi:nitric oxide synthase [Candidatus Bathyarchaeota archaeon]|nr:nitric oxide synthase [Candidatus Bathyarchaeota archaeon]